jgi:hypothetical protein
VNPQLKPLPPLPRKIRPVLRPPLLVDVAEALFPLPRIPMAAAFSVLTMAA